VRALLASAHYRSPIDFSPEGLDEAVAVWQRLATFARNAREALDAVDVSETKPDESRVAAFREAIEDDFNTPAAIAVLFEIVSTGNPLVAEVESGGGDASALAESLVTFTSLAAVLGLDPLSQWPDSGEERDLVAPLVGILLEMREKARADRDFATADLIRSRLTEAGIVVEDRPGGARWRVQR
jgi:cysteinyl-tRNA synthetase